MSVFGSLALYNPLEAFLLILACNLFGNKQKNLKIKNTIISCYILSTILFCVQCPYILIKNEILYLIYDSLNTFIIMPIILFIYIKLLYNNCNFFVCYFITVLYSISIICIINIMSYPIFPNEESLFFEFIANMTMKIIQFSMIGVVFYMKKFLIKSSQNNLKNVIASTLRNFGEPKLTKKLRNEITK